MAFFGTYFQMGVHKLTTHNVICFGQFFCHHLHDLDHQHWACVAFKPKTHHDCSGPWWSPSTHFWSLQDCFTESSGILWGVVFSEKSGFHPLKTRASSEPKRRPTLLPRVAVGHASQIQVRLLHWSHDFFLHDGNFFLNYQSCVLSVLEACLHFVDFTSGTFFSSRSSQSFFQS